MGRTQEQASFLQTDQGDLTPVLSVNVAIRGLQTILRHQLKHHGPSSRLPNPPKALTLRLITVHSPLGLTPETPFLPLLRKHLQALREQRTQVTSFGLPQGDRKVTLPNNLKRLLPKLGAVLVTLLHGVYQ